MVFGKYKRYEPFIVYAQNFIRRGDYALIEVQRRLNQKMKEIRGEVWRWVDLVHVVTKKGGTTVVENENKELIPARTIIGWRSCIHYK